MGWRGVVWYGDSAVSGLKFLLRTGPRSVLLSQSYNDFLWYVGGDRSVPTPIDKSVLTVGTEWNPISIVATGPGLDDWVMCAVDARGVGGRVAFLNAAGLIKIDTLPVPSPGGINTDSTGNFASRVSIDSAAGVNTGYWSSTTASGGGVILSGYDPSQGFYFLPDAVRNLEQGVVAQNTKRQAVANAELTYSLKAPNDPSVSPQTLYRADGTRTNFVDPIVPDPAAGLTGGVSSLQMLSQACSLINLELWRWTGLDPSNISQATTAQATLTADRWQLYDDATWDYLPRVPVSYQLNSGLVRVDMSGWVEVP